MDIICCFNDNIHSRPGKSGAKTISKQATTNQATTNQGYSDEKKGTYDVALGEGAL